MNILMSSVIPLHTMFLSSLLMIHLINKETVAHIVILNLNLQSNSNQLKTDYQSNYSLLAYKGHFFVLSSISFRPATEVT